MVSSSGRPYILWIEMYPELPIRATSRLFTARKGVGGLWGSDFAAGDDSFSPSFALGGLGFGHIAAATGGNTGVHDMFHLRSDSAVTAIPDA